METFIRPRGDAIFGITNIACRLENPAVNAFCRITRTFLLQPLHSYCSAVSGSFPRQSIHVCVSFSLKNSYMLTFIISLVVWYFCRINNSVSTYIVYLVVYQWSTYRTVTKGQGSLYGLRHRRHQKGVKAVWVSLLALPLSPDNSDTDWCAIRQ